MRLERDDIRKIDSRIEEGRGKIAKNDWTAKNDLLAEGLISPKIYLISVFLVVEIESF